MFKISLLGTMNENDQRWAVYKLHEVGTLDVIFVGYSKLTDVLKTPDIRGNPSFDFNQPVIIDVVSIHNNMGEASRESSKIALQHERPRLNQSAAMVRHSPIVCVETGQQWPNAAEAARQQGIGVGNLSKHLNNQAGHKTVKGLTYKRVSTSNRALKKEAETMGEMPWVATGDLVSGKVTVWQGVSGSKDVIAAGNRENVLSTCYEWLVSNGAPNEAKTFAADYGLY